MAESEKWRDAVRVVRGKALAAAMHEPNSGGRATAFDFSGAGGSETWIGTVTLRPDGNTGPHHHGRHEVAVYIASGQSEIRWGERLEFAADVGPGDIVYFAPHVPHQERNLSASDAVIFLVVRSDKERIAVPVDLEPVDRPESVCPATPRLSAQLPGTWRLLSRIDTDATGEEVPDPALGTAPIALLFYDRSGNFAAQFMNPDRTQVFPEGPAIARNNTQAIGGYDAYFGEYAVDDATHVVTQKLLGSLSKQNVGAVISRMMTVAGNSLVIRLETAAWNGTAVTRTLTWEKVG